MSVTKRIKVRNKIVPMEKVNAGSRWWLDSDFGRQSSSKDTIEDLSNFDYGFKDSGAFGGLTVDFENPTFVYIKCKDIQNGTVELSLDGTDNTIISLGVDEAFTARLNSGVDVRVIMSGEAGIEYLIGT